MGGTTIAKLAQRLGRNPNDSSGELTLAPKLLKGVDSRATNGTNHTFKKTSKDPNKYTENQSERIIVYFYCWTQPRKSEAQGLTTNSVGGTPEGILISFHFGTLSDGKSWHSRAKKGGAPQPWRARIRWLGVAYMLVIRFMSKQTASSRFWICQVSC